MNLPDDINVLSLAKGRERYVWMWTDANRPEVLRSLRCAAADPCLSFDKDDAETLSGEILQHTTAKPSRFVLPLE